MLGGERSEAGTTLVELLVALLLATILLGLGFIALRNFWYVSSLKGASDELTTQFRRIQQEAVTGADAVAYGAVLNPGDSTWKVIRFSPNGPSAADDTCVLTETRSLDGGSFDFGAAVRVKTLVFPPPDTSSAEWVACQSLVAGTEKVAFFYRRGNTTGGTIELQQANLDPDDPDSIRTISLSSLTGRVAEV